MPRIRLDEFRREPHVQIPPTERNIQPDFFDPLPVTIKEHFPFGTREKNFYVRLQRGYKAPNPAPRIIDHQRDERLETQEHGMKIRLSTQTSEQLKTQNDDLMKTIENRLDDATNAQIRTLANVIGIPLTQEIRDARADIVTNINNSPLPVVNAVDDMKERISDELNMLFTYGHEPSQKQQKAIINILEQIRDKNKRPPPPPPLPAAAEMKSYKAEDGKTQTVDRTLIQPPPSQIANIRNWRDEEDKIRTVDRTLIQPPPSQIANIMKRRKKKKEQKEEKVPLTITPNVWNRMDDGGQNKQLRDAEREYIAQGKKVKDDGERFSKRRFIIGSSGKPITNDTVKKNMNTGNYILNLKSFKLDKL